MTPVRWFSLVVFVGCGTGGPKFLDDTAAELEVPVRAWGTEVGELSFAHGIEGRSSPVKRSISLATTPLDCDDTERYPFISFSIDHADALRPADDTDTRHPVWLVAGPYTQDAFAAAATRGWVRIDRRDDERTTGAMSWISEDEDGELIAWAEGGFDVPVCDWWGDDGR